jgi:hypothetical protein
VKRSCEAARRVAAALAVYGAGAGVLLWALPAVQRLLLLPTLFPLLVRVVLALGLPVVAVLAWRYPALGEERGEG